jgi:hypothetical protein
MHFRTATWLGMASFCWEVVTTSGFWCPESRSLTHSVFIARLFD